MLIKIAPDIVSQNDVYSVELYVIFFSPEMKVEYSQYNAPFIDSKINQFFNSGTV